MSKIRLIRCGVVLALLCGPVGASAQEAECEAVVDVDRFRYLRQLTLDLWGRVPTEAEAAALIDADEVSAEQITQMVEDDAFFEAFVRRHHQDLLWPALELQDLVNVAFSFLLPAIFYEDSGDPWRLYLLYPALYQRGGLVPCKDEPAEFDDEGGLARRDEARGLGHGRAVLGARDRGQGVRHRGEGRSGRSVR